MEQNIARVLGEPESIIRKEILRNVGGTYWEPDYVMRQKKRDFNRKRRDDRYEVETMPVLRQPRLHH